MRLEKLIDVRLWLSVTFWSSDQEHIEKSREIVQIWEVKISENEYDDYGKSRASYPVSRV